MSLKLKTICLIVVCLFFTAAMGEVSARSAADPGGPCDPETGGGHTVRLVSMSGMVNVYDYSGKRLHVEKGSFIPPGAEIRTGADSMTELALEDGTVDRLSRLRIDSDSRVVVKGGLYCSDLRPMADGGRWSAREVGLELIRGRLAVEVAEGVSHSFNLEIKTPNATAGMLRGSQHKMSVEVSVSGLDGRQLVAPVDHPKIRSHLSALMMGRDLDELTGRERDGVMKQAAMAAFSLGLVDMEAEGLLDNPQLRSTMQMMAQGRKLSELEKNERDTIMQGVSGMALQMGLVNPETLKVYDQPDEHTRVVVNAGKMRVHNKHRGWKRNEAVDVEKRMRVEIKGYGVPEITGR